MRTTHDPPDDLPRRERAASGALPAITLPVNAPVLRMTPAALKRTLADEEAGDDARAYGLKQRPLRP
jgi:hypothetical protein